MDDVVVIGGGIIGASAAYFLSKAGIITPEVMKKYRKHAFVATLILAAIITPPDVISQIIVSIPIVILYELSIFISKWVNKRRSI